jgi:uncharacterized NAD(P)/FAD-binding protein YdhS/predicted metal-dependent enzyme (double-stranded beta helix superfamily)
VDSIRGPLGQLIQKLDSLVTDPSLTNLGDALQNSHLTLEDVAPFVQESPKGYHRSLVVRREHYELLVLNWTPGQGSVPHDHANSISAMLVLQGVALEGSWRIARDGYVDLEYETEVRAGELTAWQDAGVHTVRNSESAEQSLITLHVYSPPLSEFRRYARRSGDEHRPPLVKRTGPPTIAVVGGGFSGSACAAQILKQANAAGRHVKVLLIERQGCVGEGLAYSTRELCHLLNVPAARMSAWPDEPEDFLNWAKKRDPEVKGSDFLPRRWYGEYVRERLAETARCCVGVAEFSVLFDEVRRLARHPQGGWMLNFAGNSATHVDTVIMAIGHRPPQDPIGRLWSGPRSRFLSDPWRQFATNPVKPNENAVVIGSGLTAIDAVLSLSQEPRSGVITLISRRGLVPQSHSVEPVTPLDLKPLVTQLVSGDKKLTTRKLLHELRRLAKETMASGGNWRAVVDGVRPHTATLWQALSNRERLRFLGRLRPYWEIFRHRMAPNIARTFDDLVKTGRVRVIAGSIASAQADDEMVRLYVRERGDDRLMELRADWVVNCTGPTASNSADANPAIGSLLVHGWIARDELSLGLLTTPDGNAIDAQGEATTDLFVIGTLRKPATWESTAVPELRQQAAMAAKKALEQVCQRHHARQLTAAEAI